MSSTEVNVKPVKVDKWDGVQVKNGLDDAVKAGVKERIGFEEDFKYTDLKLGICLLACSFSMFALAYGYFVPFPDCELVLGVCSVSYFVLMGVLSLFTLFKEKKIIMWAYKNSNGKTDRLEVSTTLPKFESTYTITLALLKDGQAPKTASSKKSIGAFIDQNGVVVTDLVGTEVRNLFKRLQDKKE
eukprot:Colp12_sorted_trinity150504_noHs@29842